MPQVELGEVRIAYEVVGTGDPLVLLAGCGQPAIAWHLGFTDPLVQAGYQVVTIDNRGVEPSSSPPAPYSVDQMAGDTLGLLDHLGFSEPVRLAGHSMGGWIAETLALDHPTRVRSVALMGSANVPSAWEKAITEVERDFAVMDTPLPRLHMATETLRYLPNHQLQDDEIVGSWLALLSDVEPWPNPGRLGQYEACLAWSNALGHGERWPTMSVPALVVAFEYDIDSPPAKARQAAEAMPGASYVEIADASHLGIMTHTAEVTAALVHFFSAH